MTQLHGERDIGVQLASPESWAVVEPFAGKNNRQTQKSSTRHRLNICVVQNLETSVSETFIRAHAARLPNAKLICGGPPHLADDEPPSPNLSQRAYARVRNLIRGDRLEHDHYTREYIRHFSRLRAEAVLAEYGPSGVAVMNACHRLRLPLVVHFHGYDASRYDILERYGEEYAVLFQRAAAIIVVSRAMEHALINLGAPPSKVHNNPCGVDPKLFAQSDPSQALPTFLAVGRLVEKKAPHLLILAFSEVHSKCPEAKLRIIGDGPLLGVCQDLASGLSIRDAVEFLGSQPHDVVRAEMSRARAFIQHSVVAKSGDTEGTPVAVLEAGAASLPVVATRHAGIPDVVQHGRTGLLVEERDISGMAEAMLQLARDPARARLLGMAARARISANYSMDESIQRLWSIIKDSVSAS